MIQQEAEQAMREGKFVTAPEGNQIRMGKLVSRSGHFFTLKTAEGRRIPNLIADKISPTSRNY